MNEVIQNARGEFVVPQSRASRVIALNRLSPTGYELILDRGNLDFQPGQLINLHGRNHLESRSYSVCSGINDETLTVLFRYIPNGILTPQLITLRPDDRLNVSGPYGEFVIRDLNRSLVFFATGTGVAPCRCYHRSHPNLDLTLIHGVRTGCDLFYREEFSSISYQPCLSGPEDDPSVFHGRVTDYARITSFAPGAHFYLCGANEMIYEIQEILEARGIERSSIFTEPYYYRSDDS